MSIAARVVVLLLLLGALLTTGSAPAAAESPLLPDKLAIYYGYPSLVNGSAGDLSAATEVFNDYDLVVFGDGLQDPAHTDHANTSTIISNLQTPPNDTAAYGYIPIGVTNLPPSQISMSVAEIESRVDAWDAMGVAGVFLDQAGYDFGVSRQRQNEVVDYVHGKGLSVFINAWEPDHVFSPAVEPTHNPTGAATHLGSSDIYLHESFQIILSGFQDPAFWVYKSEKALTYKGQFGTQMAVVTTVSQSDPGFDQSKFDYAWWSTLLYGFDFMGWGEPVYSALDNNLPFRTRPDPGKIGGAFTSPVIHAPPVHTRTTTAGTIEVNTDTHTGEFIASPVGGIAELPEVAGTPLEAPDSSGPSVGVLAGIGAAAAASALGGRGGAAWWARRRRIR